MEILCEVSMRHVHLCRKDVEELFGKEAKLEFERALSQPGQFLAKQRVTLIGEKRANGEPREIENVAVLGPERAESQVELSRTDCFALGIKNVPVRQSGDIKNSPGAVIKVVGNGQYGITGPRTVTLNQGVIVAKRHVHLDPKTAAEGGFINGEIVKLKFEGERATVFEKCVVRVADNFAPAVHIDSDEGNAVDFAKGEVKIIKE